MTVINTVTSFERLNPCQKNAVVAVRTSYGTGRNRALVVLPSGAGKTSVCGQVALEHAAAGRRVLYTAGREELLERTGDELSGRFGLACYTGVKEVLRDPRKDTVLLSTVRAVSAQDVLSGIPEDFFDLVVIDDADGASAALYGKILDRFGRARGLGTASDAEHAGDGPCAIFGDAANDGERACDATPVDSPSCSRDDVPPTRSQLACLARMGIDVSTVHTKRQASKIIGSTPHATPTVKQIELLTRKGFRDVAGWTYQQAHELITRISDNRWTIPTDIGDPAAYVPC